jgi:AAA+ superfamily predicted ATPase
MLTTELVLGRVRARARLRAAWLERMWNEGRTSYDQGLAITPGEVRQILTEPGMEAERYRQFLEEKEVGQMSSAAEEADEALAWNGFWNWMVETFDLDTRERDLLCLLVAVELDPRLGRVLAYLADDTRATSPSAAIAATLFENKQTVAGPVVTQMPELLRWRLAQPLSGEAAWQAKTAWHADEAVLLSVVAERWVDPSLERVARLIEPGNAKQLPCLYPEIMSEMLAQPLNPRDGKDEATEIVLVGPEGSGRETLAAQYAATTERSLLAVKTPLLLGLAGPDAGAARNAMVRAARWAHATGALLYWRDAEGVSPSDWSEVRAITAVTMRGAQAVPATATHSFTLKPLPTAKRVEVWRHYSEAPPAAIVRTQRLTPAEVRLASAADEATAIQIMLRRAVPIQADLLQRVPCPYTWDDLVVSADLRRMLGDFEAQVRLRWEVYEEWGFARLTHLGQGISALFGGPSGTGKTMAAQVLARSLGLALYRVDLAGVVNKYVGETEKRLRDVFDACERSGALLFFDEADALFGSRMQVKDAHDRFANIEIDYLLQRIEQFDGIAILATNRKNDLDAAFLRRLRFVVDFLNPGNEERRALWEKALPKCSPAGESIVGEIDFGMLASDMELNGAQIKSIALGAAFLAKSAGTRIGLEHIELSAQREFAKQGQLRRASFGKAEPL